MGNVLRRDDGVGPSAVRRLESEHVFPASVTLLDLGTPGLDLPSHLVGLDVAVVLDAAALDAPPGSVRVLDRDGILACGTPPPRITGHEADLREALVVAALAGGGPREVWLVGVVPADLGDGVGLTPAVEAAVGVACERALEILGRHGVRPVRRAVALDAGAWWETAART
jgi:hydrogenase maturation protease